MSLTIVILLLCIAFGLILIEIFLIPGVGIPGIAGVVLKVSALVLAYQIDDITGHYTLGVTALISVGLIALALRSKTWEKISQKEEIRGRAGAAVHDLKAGDRGITVGRLNPIGNVRFGDVLFEARSKGDYIPEKCTVEIVTIEGTKITVKPI